MKQPSLRFYMYLSIAAALVTMGVKFLGYFLTGSVGLFSDAALFGLGESCCAKQN